MRLAVCLFALAGACWTVGAWIEAGPVTGLCVAGICFASSAFVVFLSSALAEDEK